MAAPAAKACTLHAAAPAEWQCAPCRAWYCGACVKVIGPRTASCLTCGALAVPVTQTPGLRGPVAKAELGLQMVDPLSERVFQTVFYLKQPSLLLWLAIVAVFVWAAQFGFGGPGLLLAIFAGGLRSWTYFSIVTQSAYGEDDLRPPELGDFWEVTLAPLVRYGASLLPLLLALYLAAQAAFEFAADPRVGFAWPLAPTMLFIAWLLLWPLMTCIAAISRSVFAMYDPFIWVSTLRQLGPDYVVGAFFFYAVLALEFLLIAPALIVLEKSLGIPVIGGILVTFLGLVPMAWRARVLGDMCRPYVA